MIKLKRVYEKAEKSDGYRILIDRIWPRGISKEKAKIAIWMKDIAPTKDLVKWFHAKEGRWEEFVKKYKSELKKNETVIKMKEILSKHKTVTFVYSAKDEEHNQAVILKDYLSS